jgi:hypothetical protein
LNESNRIGINADSGSVFQQHCFRNRYSETQHAICALIIKRWVSLYL